MSLASRHDTLSSRKAAAAWRRREQEAKRDEQERRRHRDRPQIRARGRALGAPPLRGELARDPPRELPPARWPLRRHPRGGARALAGGDARVDDVLREPRAP